MGDAPFIGSAGGGSKYAFCSKEYHAIFSRAAASGLKASKLNTCLCMECQFGS